MMENDSSRGMDARILKDQATAVLEHPAISLATNAITDGDAKPQSHDITSRSERRTRSGRATPLKLHTKPVIPPPEARETIATSPNLSKHVIPVAKGAETTLPAMHSVPDANDGAATSPQLEKLPSLHQITTEIDDRLNAFAEVAAQQDHRPYSHHHSNSTGSATNQSPMMHYNSYPNVQTSPPIPYALTTQSPIIGSAAPFYGSPPQHHHSAYFADRRSSASYPLQLPPSLPSASSSGESQEHASSTTDGYSTAHTTPLEVTQTSDSTPRPMFPPPPGMPVMNGFKCDELGCSAPPFQTQYLLGSHKNVHSQIRNHYCPFEGCVHAEGGKGFKRKNEMIRHQLVHRSPGYVCPFCPDREHKYPRPDNLQRHVRVHHVDRERDDPLLCEVLAKRNEGNGKARRRRGTAASA